MLARSIKQLLMAGGFNDAEAFAMVDALCDGGFGMPHVEMICSGTLDIAPGSQATAISTSNATDDFTLVIIRRQHNEKALPATRTVLALDSGS